MTTSELKAYIYNNEKVSFILEKLGCHHIKYRPAKNYFTCANADNGDNPNAVLVYNNEYLKVVNFTRDLTKIDASPDIITLTRYYKKIDFRQAVKWLHNELDLKYVSNMKPKEENHDPLSIFKSLHRYKKNSIEYKILNEDLLTDFYPYIHKDFIKEGIILKSTIKKFQLGYSYEAKGTIIPIRYWLDGSLIGIIRRTSVENYEMFDIPKYFPIKPYLKSGNVYGLWENYQGIQDKKYCVVFEAQKSVLKRDTFKDYTATAVCGHDISEEQVNILCGLNLNEIVIAFDKDVELNEIRGQCEKFYGLRNVSYIYDTYNLLGEKDAPCDCGDDVYQYLFEHRINYNTKEHEEYKKYLAELNRKG